MLPQLELTHKLETVFDRPQAALLAEVITAAYTDLVKTGDFNELKAIVRELAQAQKELTQAQQETQHEIKLLTQKLGETNSTLGGLGQSVAYALENEAYRMLPGVLARKYNLTMTERLIRTDIGGEEINLFGRGERDGQPVLIVGESKARLDERRQKKQDVFDQLAAKMAAVKRHYPDQDLVPVIITHYARPKVLQQAEAEGIIVVQSFEW